MNGNHIKEKGMQAVFFAAACASILAVALICIFLFANGVPAISQIGIGKFLLGTQWKPGNDIYGILPMILGSIYVTAGAILIGVPEVLLMDEPTSALDPISTSKIEDLAMSLKEKYTIVIVTHNMQQAVRISDDTAFFLLGEMVEFGNTHQLFARPMDKRTEDYITGRLG